MYLAAPGKAIMRCVSLLDMLNFPAAEISQISHGLGVVLGNGKKNGSEFLERANWIGDLVSLSNRLGLTVTREHCADFVVQIARNNPKNVKLVEAGENSSLTIPSTPVDPVWLAQQIELIQTTLVAEMRSMKFTAIPKDRNAFCDPKWLADTKTVDGFPTSHRELQQAGNCYAVGQPTACVFHAMRALEPALTALAGNFSIDASHSNWQTLIERIESTIRALGNQPKTQQKIDDETFFGNAASHFYFIKNAWRNHVAHGRATYSDDEALKILQSTVQFVESLCAKLSEVI